jgi:site-specific DNA recombinase
MRTVRCAIYTRKSSEEGLEQDFNSLDAQREACAAYILSQASEGWVALPDIYDDGGLSGGTLARPALQRLLGSIAEGRIDTVVVYKVDRLTRSLMDFSKLVETFDKAGTSFVSVTQSFNTTTSMGRLTLNMLLSFAQFEREVTAERIRDKLAASKAKGMWMGGVPPVGYRPNGRTLSIVPDEAVIVRGIFERYLALGNVREVREALANDGVLTPVRNSTKGGGRAFSRGQIYTILNNPIYRGLIRHKDKTYPGLHDEIIEQDIWDAAQAKLADNLQGHRSRVRHPHRSLLAGKVVDENGTSLAATHASKGKVRHRYYVSPDTASGSPMRIPARQLEAAVIGCVSRALDDRLAMMTACGIEFGTQDLRSLLSGGNKAPSPAEIAELIRQVSITESGIEIRSSANNVAQHIGLPCPATDHDVVLTSDARLRRSGQMIKLIKPNGMPLTATPNTALVRLVVLAHRWWAEMRKDGLSVGELAARLGVSRPYVTRVLRLAFLSPRITDAIIAGSANAAVGCRVLTRADGVEIIDQPWVEQEGVLLAA